VVVVVVVVGVVVGVGAGRVPASARRCLWPRYR